MRTLTWSLWSSTARLVVTEDRVLDDARALCEVQLALIDAAANRFDPASEISRLPVDGRTVSVSPLLAALVGEGLAAAGATRGAVDPTVGQALVDLGYDRDIARLRREGSAPRVHLRRRTPWQAVQLSGSSLRMPPGIRLDLGATAKASAADRCARLVHESLDTGVLVELGGDLATAGRGPEEGWRVHVQDAPGEPADEVVLRDGDALATSSTLVRRWRQGDVVRHHVVDPATGTSARSPWRTVTVAGGTCLAANIAATAAIVRGRGALGRLPGPARLVDTDGVVHRVHGWPEPVVAA